MEDPRRRQLDEAIDARQQYGRRPADRAAQDVDGTVGRRRRDGGAGQQHVTDAVEADDQRPRHAIALRHDSTSSTADAKICAHVGDAADLERSCAVVRHHHADRTGTVGGGDVGAGVADHDARCRVDVEQAGGQPDETGSGLAAGATVIVVVRARHDHVERTEQLAQPGVHLAQLLLADQAARHAALIGDHTDVHAGSSRPSQRSRYAGQRLDE